MVQCHHRDGVAMKEPSSSKSKVELDARCRRERFLATIYGGHGIESQVEPLELAFGNAIHYPLEKHLTQPKEGAAYARDIMLKYMKDNLIQGDVAFEYPILAESLVYGFTTRVVPDILRDYEVVSTEMKAVYIDPKTGVKWRARPDLVLRRKKDGSIWYFEWKTSAVDPESFTRMWSRKAQLHLGALALEQTHGLSVEGVIVQGFYKGTKYKGSLRSRMVGGYRRLAPPGVGKSTYRVTHAAGFEWFSASEYPGGVTAWVDQLPTEIIAETFPVTPPIVPNAKFVREFLDSQGWREQEIAEAIDNLDIITQQLEDDTITSEQAEEMVEATIAKVFPKNVDACEDPVRHTKCQFYEVCWNPIIGRDPIGSGVFKAKIYKDGDMVSAEIGR